MTEATLNTYFDALETHLNQLALAVASGDALTIPTLSEQVHHFTVHLAENWRQWQGQGLTDVGLHQRLNGLAEGLRVVRAGLLRRAMLVEQTLNLVVPASVDITYTGNSAYGSGPKASGRLPVVSA
jgi:hypothetical protein